MPTARIAVFVSGTGRHLENLAKLGAADELDCSVALVVANRAGIGALDHARRFELRALVLDPTREWSDETFSEHAFAAVEDAACEVVVLAGFLRKLVVPESWNGRVLNIHPALLPAFGGKGYYGSRVHKAVLEHRCWFSGCTVHYVDNEYDHGPILLQRCVEVARADTPETLADRVFAEELIALPEALRLHFARRERG